MSPSGGFERLGFGQWSSRAAASVQAARIAAMSQPPNRAICAAVSSSVGGPVRRPLAQSSATAAMCATTSRTDQPGQAASGRSMPRHPPVTNAVIRSRVS